LPEKKKYALVFSPEASSSILRIFSPFLLQSGYSDVKKVNFPRVLNIIDNKTIEDQPGSLPFDDEGIQGGETVIVEKGVFNTPITNIKSALNLNTISSGNGFRRGESPFTSVNFSNLYIRPTVLPVGNLLKGSGESVLISLVRLKYREGGKYVFSAYGYIFRDGKREEAVHFHFSTTFLSYFLNIQKISKEIKFFHSGFNVGSPYVLLNAKFELGDLLVI
jgi:predicted Zn-dependent protease